MPTSTEAIGAVKTRENGNTMRSDPLAEIDPRFLGARLRQAREARGWTQQQVADQLGVARTTLVAIEKGERRIRPEELMRLGALYERQLWELLQRGAPPEGFAVQLRTSMASGPVDAGLVSSIEVFERLAEDYVRLEKICQAPLRRRHPPQYEIEGLDPELAGEDVACSERNRLGLGDGPLSTLRDILENDVGIRIFQPELPLRVAGMFAYTEDLGACIAVNQHHPQERRALSLAQEYGHFLTDRFHPEILTLEGGERRPRAQRFSDAFARSFLMPSEGLRKRYLELQRERKGAVTRGDLYRLASFYFVSVEAMARRLTSERLIPAGTWDRLRQEGFEIRETAEPPPQTRPEDALPPRYVSLAVEAWQRAELSEGQLAQMLRTDRVGAREIIGRAQGLSTEEGATADLVDWSAPLLRVASR